MAIGKRWPHAEDILRESNRAVFFKHIWSLAFSTLPFVRNPLPIDDGTCERKYYALSLFVCCGAFLSISLIFELLPVPELPQKYMCSAFKAVLALFELVLLVTLGIFHRLRR